MLVCSEWSATITEKTGGGDLVGFLQVTFARMYNPQSIAKIAGA
jgi:hypothetical protein